MGISSHFISCCCVQVPFEVLAKRQISRLLDPSLQCARFVYDELVKVRRLLVLWMSRGRAWLFLCTSQDA